MAGELAKTKTGEPVQTEEKAIVRDLDELIAALEKECAELSRHETQQSDSSHG